ALELLLSTPVTIREVVNGSLLGLKRLFYRPVVVLMATEGLLLAGQIFLMQSDGTPGNEIAFSVVGVFLVVALGIMDFFGVAHYGLWMGLRTRNAGKAVTKTVLHVLVIPLLGTACVVLYPVVTMVKDAVLIGYAQERLRRYFRAVVTERYGLGENESSRYVT